MTFEHWIDTDLTQLPVVRNLQRMLTIGSQDDNLVGIRLTNGGTPAAISGTVKANIIRGDGSTIEATGSIQNSNEAYVVLPSSAYTILGHLGVYLRVESNGTVTTLGGVETYITPDRSGNN